MTELAPGWYKDPAEPTTQRYWDGEGWLGDPLPIDATPPPGPPKDAAPVIWPPPRPTRAQPVQAPPAPATPPAPPAPPTPAVPRPGAHRPPGAAGWPPPRTPVRWVPGMPAPLMVAVPRPHGFPVAPLGLRVLARLIDIVAVFGLNVLGNGWLVYLYLSDIWPAVEKIRDQMLHPRPDPAAVVLPAIPGRAQWLLTMIPIVAMALWFAYEVPAIAQRGQTLGKRVVGIKVLPLETAEQPGGAQSIGFLRSIRRWNPLGLPVLLWTCGLGFLLQLVDAISPVLGGPLHLALHDRSAGTVVVHSGRKGHEITPVKNPGEAP